MNKLNEKIDIMQVIIAPLYKLNIKNGYVNINNPYIHSNKWVAIYPVEGTNLKSFYNLSDNLNIINLKPDKKLEDKVVDLNGAKLLSEYIDDVKKISKKRYMKYNDILYIIVPIAQHEKYKNNDMKKRRKYVSLSRRFLTTDLYYKNHIECNAIVEKKNHFAIDMDNNEPVSYGYINDEIPYILRKRK